MLCVGCGVLADCALFVGVSFVVRRVSFVGWLFVLWRLLIGCVVVVGSPFVVWS